MGAHSNLDQISHVEGLGKGGCTLCIAQTKRVPTWNPDCEQVVVTETLVRVLPAGGIPVAGHGLDHHDGQGEVSLHRFLIVMDRLALLGGVFRSETFLLVFLKTANLVLSVVTDRMLVAKVGVLEAGIDALHL